ncbi:hypothetical protein ARMGADRAFT_1008421 [Armillaria gallica]|uniref:Protein kinase domain-containing protein n=1 Tax=Armillaria gallica TaxID=47427 RepID=A0A2H3E0U1_ARMGA|nr:hypothetical protein ARMGADRAFT_1008421 [Armillaria gallica]
MMDPTKMYPKGFLPERPFMKVNCSGFVSPSCTHAMVKENPSERPTIDDVVIRFDTLRKSLSRWRL